MVKISELTPLVTGATGDTGVVVQSGETYKQTNTVLKTYLRTELASAAAWVNYNQVTNTVVDDFNVSTVTDISAGKYTVNFTSAMTNANYCVVVSNDANSTSFDRYSWLTSKSTSSCDCRTGNNGGTGQDVTSNNVVVFAN